jgi:serine/threonine protein kinase
LRWSEGGHSGHKESRDRSLRLTEMQTPIDSKSLELEHCLDESRSGLTILNGGYRVTNLIYRGTWSDVYSAITVESDASICLKAIPVRRLRPNRMLHRELWFHRNFLNAPPTIVTIKDWFFDFQRSASVCLVMDLCEFTLADFVYSVSRTNVKRVDSREISRFMSDMIISLTFLETNRIVHRDIHTKNILWSSKGTQGTWKLSDFGSCCIADDTAGLNTHCGNLVYSSPESIKGDEITTKSDVWSLGCCIFECLTMVRPFSTVQLFKYKNTSKSKHEFPIHNSVRMMTSQRFSKYGLKIFSIVMEKMLVADPRVRSDASKIVIPELILNNSDGILASAMNSYV